ncbi:hypothetical protein OAV31_00050 [bacterium]|nr:hypothetical protein [bacterium]
MEIFVGLRGTGTDDFDPETADLNFESTSDKKLLKMMRWQFWAIYRVKLSKNLTWIPQ